MTRLCLAICTMLLMNAAIEAQQYHIGDLCKIKGQEQNQLRGVGLVVGLNGTGDPEMETTARSTAELLKNSGLEIPKEIDGRPITSIYKDAKNVALVFVTATVPAEGARQGSRISCQIHAWGSATSLKGGYLMETALTGGPAPADPSQLPVLATAAGRITLDDPNHATSGKIHSGAQLQVDFYHRFFEEIKRVVPDPAIPGQTKEVRERYLNLVIKKDYASFETAYSIVERINGRMNEINNGPEQEFARAIDPINITVKFVDTYFDDPVGFANEILNTIPIGSNRKNAVVVVNRRTGTITVGDDVYFQPAAVSSGEFSVEAGMFRELALSAEQQVAPQAVKLKQLVQALNQIQAPASTKIDVIMQLKAGGLLFGKVIEEY